MSKEGRGGRRGSANVAESPQGDAADTTDAGGPIEGGENAGEGDQAQDGAEMAPALADGPTTPDQPAEDHITAFDRQMDRLVRIVDESEFESGSLRGDIRDTMLDVIKSRPKPWSQMSELEQRDLVKALDAVTTGIVKKVVFVLAEQDDLSVHATLKGYSVDGDTFKLKATAKGDEDTAMQLFRLDGHEVVIISADSKRYQGARTDPKIDPDQPGFGFADQEIRSEPPKPPADDSDLNPEGAGPGGVVASPAMRVNLKDGTIEELSADGDPDDETAWKAVRDATPEELASAREAQADFDDDAEDAD